MSETLPTLFGGLTLVIFLFVILARLPDQLRALIAAGVPLIAYFVFIVGRWPGMDVVAIHIAVYSSAGFIMLMITRYRARSSGKLHWAPKAFIVFFLVLTGLMAGFLYIANQGLPPRLAAWILPSADKTVVRTGFSGVLQHGEEAAKTVGSQLSEQYRQGRLNWAVAVQGLQMPNRGENNIIVEAADTEGRPLSHLTAVLVAKRPGETGQGKPMVLDESSPGTYAGHLLLQDSGRWLISLNLTQGEERYHQEWEVQVP